MHFVARRLLLLFLAALPTVWGTCPRWLDGSMESNVVAKRCPCCSPVGNPTPRPDCGGCPVLEVRHSSAPAPQPTVVPPMDGAVVARTTPWPAATSGTHAIVSPPSVDPSGGAPPWLGTVVLIV